MSEVNASFNERRPSDEEVAKQVAELFERIKAAKPESVIVVFATSEKVGCLALGKPVELPQLYDAGAQLLAQQLRRMVAAQNAGNG